MENNKKHVPDYEISTYSNRKPTEYTHIQGMVVLQIHWKHI